MNKSSKRMFALLFVGAALGTLLDGCAAPEQLAQNACQSPWAAAGNNGVKADRPAVVREMSNCS
jgi:hypothetical protein